MDETRRLLVGVGAALGAVGLVSAAVGAGEAATSAGQPDADPIPPLPATPTPGKPGDFDFLGGEWRIQHWRLPKPGAAWDVFEGSATCWTILGGVGSVEELRIPARNFSGMGLRMLDVEQRVWSDFWVNARSGVLQTPGQTGSFENGAGVFASDDTDDAGPYKAVGVWDRITPTSCRWRQATSRDGGRSWDVNWIMHWTRASSATASKRR